MYDANGVLVSGGGAAVNAAVSSPFTLADDGWGTPQSIMLVAGLLMLAAILIPPVIIRRSGARTNRR